MGRHRGSFLFYDVVEFQFNTCVNFNSPHFEKLLKWRCCTCPTKPDEPVTRTTYKDYQPASAPLPRKTVEVMAFLHVCCIRPL